MRDAGQAAPAFPDVDQPPAKVSIIQPAEVRQRVHDPTLGHRIRTAITYQNAIAHSQQTMPLRLDPRTLTVDGPLHPRGPFQEIRSRTRSARQPAADSLLR
jgi:hypothetical protein